MCKARQWLRHGLVEGQVDMAPIEAAKRVAQQVVKHTTHQAYTGALLRPSGTTTRDDCAEHAQQNRLVDIGHPEKNMTKNMTKDSL